LEGHINRLTIRAIAAERRLAELDGTAKPVTSNKRR
jgi:hypothetical protein